MNLKKRILTWGVGSMLVFTFVWQQMQSVRIGFELEKTRRTVEAQRDQNAYLHMEMERILSPDWLAQAAQGRLHMIPLTPESLIVLKSSENQERSLQLIRKLIARGTRLQRSLNL